MGRRTETITIKTAGRDKGKVFILTEMPAVAAERWATQALALLLTAGVPVDESQKDAGMEGLAAAIQPDPDAPLDPAVAMRTAKALQDPSLDAWWGCVQYQHAPGQQPMPIDQGENCPIEEIMTISFLRMQVLALHTDFFSAASASTSASPSRAIPTGSRPTRMSRPR